MAFPTTLLCLLVALVVATHARSAQVNKTWEEIFLAVPDANKARDHLLYYTSQPHIAGSPGDKATADYTLQKFLEYGINATIEEYQVLLTYPLKRHVEIVYPESERFVASLKEPVVAEDPTSNDTRAVDTFNGYAPSGNVTAQLVYANYGRLQDFQLLASMGVNVSGKIVIVRYGAVFRGVKAMIAQQYGAVGVLIYSDPHDDGFARGDVYPKGPWRPEQGVQRGSVQFLSVCPGDPLDTTDCLAPGDKRNYSGVLIPNIPVQPLSWGDALPLLRGLTNNPVNSSWPGWAGALNITYGVGPGPVEVHLETEIEFNVTTIWNVIATIDGEDTSKTVLLGNHRDAWVFGATDPSSGSSVLLEIASGYGALLKEGWKPKRNIVLCSWDAEEYGLVGSTAYARRHKDVLSSSAVAYLNVDVGVSGRSFGCSGTPTLKDLIVEAAGSVPYPGTTTDQTILDTWNHNNFGVLGSGSDYTAFIHNLGIASIDVGFGGIGGGVYHSNYDSFYFMDTFGDPGFIFHKGMAQFLGLVGLRLVDAEVLPHNYTHYANALESYALTIVKTLNSTEGAPDLHVPALQNAIANFLQVGDTIMREKVSQNLEDTQGVSKINDRLVFTERAFLQPAGLPGRPFFKHVIQAPALYSGYGAITFPGLTQAIEDKNWDEALQQSDVIAFRIGAASEALAGVSNPGPKKPSHTIAIVLGVLGGVAFVTGIGLGVYFYYKKRNHKYEAV